MGKLNSERGMKRNLNGESVVEKQSEGAEKSKKKDFHNEFECPKKKARLVGCEDQKFGKCSNDKVINIKDFKNTKKDNQDHWKGEIQNVNQNKARENNSATEQDIFMLEGPVKKARNDPKNYEVNHMREETLNQNDESKNESIRKAKNDNLEVVKIATNEGDGANSAKSSQTTIIDSETTKQVLGKEYIQGEENKQFTADNGKNYQSCDKARKESAKEQHTKMEENEHKEEQVLNGGDFQGDKNQETAKSELPDVKTTSIQKKEHDTNGEETKKLVTPQKNIRTTKQDERRSSRILKSGNDKDEEITENDRVAKDHRNSDVQRVIEQKNAKEASKENEKKDQNPIETPLIASTVFDESASNNTTKTSTGRRLTFPEKLMELLNTKNCQDAMCWLPNGNGFALHPTSFMKKILPKHFEGTKFESFTRKLNRWGFKRIAGEDAPEDTFAYSHHLFKREYPELCRGMSGGKKMEQDFSHLIRYRERERLLSSTAANPGGLLTTGRFGFGGLPGAPNMVGMGAMGTIGAIGGMSAMGGMGLQPGFEQQAQLQNFLFERQLAVVGGMGATPYGNFVGARDFERELAFREMFLRQDAATGSQSAYLQQQRFGTNNNIFSPNGTVSGIMSTAPGSQTAGQPEVPTNMVRTPAPIRNMQQTNKLGASVPEGMINGGVMSPQPGMLGAQPGAIEPSKNLPAPQLDQIAPSFNAPQPRPTSQRSGAELMKLHQQNLGMQQQLNTQSGNTGNLNGLEGGATRQYQI